MDVRSLHFQVMTNNTIIVTISCITPLGEHYSETMLESTPSCPATFLFSKKVYLNFHLVIVVNARGLLRRSRLEIVCILATERIGAGVN